MPSDHAEGRALTTAQVAAIAAGDFSITEPDNVCSITCDGDYEPTMVLADVLMALAQRVQAAEAERDAAVQRADRWSLAGSDIYAERDAALRTVAERDARIAVLEAALELEREESVIARKRLDRIGTWLDRRGVVPAGALPEHGGDGVHQHIKTRLEWLVTQEQARGREQMRAERDERIAALEAALRGLESRALYTVDLCAWDGANRRSESAVLLSDVRAAIAALAPAAEGGA